MANNALKATTFSAFVTGTTLTLTGTLTGVAATLSGTLTANGAAALNGTTTIGNGTTDTCTFTGRCIVRTVANAVANSVAGTIGEIAFDSTTTKFVGCTVTGEVGLATWISFT